MPLEDRRPLKRCSIHMKLSRTGDYLIEVTSWAGLTGKLLHNRLISLRKEVWAHQSLLTPPIFIDVPVPSQGSERSCIGVWVRGRLSSKGILSLSQRGPLNTGLTVYKFLFLPI
jgi:hypothetical protein